MNKLEFILPSSLDGIICKVENIIENIYNEFQLNEILRAKITLSMIEAVSNSIRYGNTLDPQKTVLITVHKGKGQIIVTVKDEGKGFDFKNLPDPTTPNNLMKETGRGLYLINLLTDKLFFAQNGAKIIMVFSTEPKQLTVYNHGK